MKSIFLILGIIGAIVFFIICIYNSSIKTDDDLAAASLIAMITIIGLTFCFSLL